MNQRMSFLDFGILPNVENSEIKVIHFLSVLRDKIDSKTWQKK